MSSVITAGRRLLPVLAIAGGTVWMAASACSGSQFTSPATDSGTGPGETGALDGAGLTDASDGTAPQRWCAVHNPTANFCDDFDEFAKLDDDNNWTPFTLGTAPALDFMDSSSPPASVLFTTTPLDGSKTPEVTLTHAFVAPAMPDSIYLRFDVELSDPASCVTAGNNPNIAVIGFPSGNQVPYQLVFLPGTGGVSELAEVTIASDAAALVPHFIGASVPATWTTIVIQGQTLQSSPTATVSVGTYMSPPIALQQRPPGPPFLVLGLAENGNVACTMHLDNVAFNTQ